MTGFGKATVDCGTKKVIVEVKSLNSKQLDINLRTPSIYKEKDIEIRTGDIREAAAVFGRASFSVVTCNPPYMTGSHGLVNPHLPKAIARHEVLCTLEDVISQAAQVLEPRGRFYMVHRPFRLAEIMGLMMKYQLEPKRMRLVYP